MKDDVSVMEYFYNYAEQAGSKEGIRRATNGLVRGKVGSMNQLCAMSQEDLHKMRNVGAQTVELVMRVREQYIKERAEQE